MEKRIESAIRDAELEGPIGYYTLLKSQLSFVDDAFSKGDRKRIWHNLCCSYDLISVYMPSGDKKRRLKKRVSNLDDITDHTEFITEANEIYHVIIMIIEEKTGKIQKW